ncbi:hypothetical protein J4477_04770 [Candidatus Pacearchaeota archaeon]|nr:hypothetical protein [Candidatus Pacearchaeota archaeon]
MDLEKLKKRLSAYKKEDIIFTTHTKIRALARNMNLEEVRNNIINPEKLVFYREQKAENVDEEKYECYFAYSENHCHEYVLVLNRKIIIVTIIDINRNWQKIIQGLKK